ncbi:MAG: GntR family transcriptional regulator [Hyphomicrobiales bacterium]|nr:GntR family transcriptional regulator [Hyphomicrobiales bacterium]
MSKGHETLASDGGTLAISGILDRPAHEQDPAFTVHDLTLNETAYRRLRKEIVGCTLPPGQAVTESGLCARLGMGKAPIRAALTRLGQENLVQAIPRRGYRIAPITMQDIQDLFQLRLVLEPRAAELAAGRLTADQILRMRESCNVTYEPGNQESQARFLEANRTFHTLIAEASGNRKLTAIIYQLLSEVERILHLCLKPARLGEHFQTEHLELMDALLAGEAERARVLVYDQVKGGQKAVVETALATPGLIEADGDPA